jgi:hypothetical protein
MTTILYSLTTLALGFLVFVLLIPHGNRAWVLDELRRFKSLSRAGGYVHDTQMCQYIPPVLHHCVTGTWTETAGQVTGTISKHKAAAAETTTINVPVVTPSNASALKGTYLKYVEIDHELTGAAATSVTLTLNKVTRGADTAVDVVSAVTGTQLLTAATTAATQDQHRDRFTLTTPAYISDNEFYLLKVVMVCAAGTVVDLGGSFAYFTTRL